MYVLDGAVTREGRAWPGTVDHEMETRAKRIHHHLSKTAGPTRKTTKQKSPVTHLMRQSPSRIKVG